MKKVMILALVISGFAMTSCKKDWTCECTSTDGTNSATTSSVVENTTKSKAEAACNYTLTVGSSSTTCAIK